MHLNELRQQSTPDLVALAHRMGIECNIRSNKKDLIMRIVRQASLSGEEIYSEGVLEIMPDGFGFIRSLMNSYAPSPDDIYVSPNQIRRFQLNMGDTVLGRIRQPKEGERYLAFLQALEVNRHSIESMQYCTPFEDLKAYFPTQQLILERGDGKDLTGRMIDLFAPIGKGQRAMIVSQPKAGKTLVLKDIAQSITHNHPECYLIVLLIDERPEEVTDMERSVQAEVIASTFDEPPTRHVQVTEIVMEKAKRIVEKGTDVVILLDSMTRLARAYNTVVPNSGKILTGGVDVQALQHPKRFFGAARSIDHGGSLTIIASALIDTGSKMDEVIYEEFKGTGNSEIMLDRSLAEQGIYPAINIQRSSTRRAELLISAEGIKRMNILRKLLSNMNQQESMEFLLSRLAKYRTNEEFFEAMKGGESG